MDDQQGSAWEKIMLHADPTLEMLFADDPRRVEKLSGRIELGQGGVLFDWSKTHLTDSLLDHFENLASEAGFAEKRAALFADRSFPRQRRPCPPG